MAQGDHIEPSREDSESPTVGNDAVPSLELSRLRDRLRTQLTYLGIAWILFGGVRVWTALSVPEPETHVSQFVREVAPNMKANTQAESNSFDWDLAFGAACIIAGMLVCGRVVWALYVAIALTYVEMVQAVLEHDVLAVIVWLTIVYFAHLAIRRASTLRRAGIAIGDARRSIVAIRGDR